MKLDNRILEILGQRYRPLRLSLDGEGRLLGWCGDPSAYGLDIDDRSLGQPADEWLPILTGMDLTRAHDWPLLRLPGEAVADVIVRPMKGKGADVFLLAAQQTHDLIQVTQQASNDIALLYRQLEKLSDELKKKNQELHRAINARNEFISGVSHEFRTPITTILGHCDLLASRCHSEDGEIEHSLESIGKNAKYLLALIDNILEQGEISADRLEIRLAPFKPADFFRFVIDTFQPAAKEKGLTLRSANALDEALEVLLDEHHLYLVLVNLISNALKFTDQGGVEVFASWDDDILRIRVSDSGIGIPEQEMDKILEPFSRASNVGGRRGSGLGLSIIKEVVAAMNGTMEISSTQGEGTVVSLEIPAQKLQTDAESAVRADGSNDDKKPLVMIVEDDADISALYRIILKNAGIEPVCYSDGDGFETHVQRLAPDIIVLDYNLGDDDGIVLAEKARRQGYAGPIILFTATSTINSQLKGRAMAAGCTRLLQKPRDVTNLAAIIHQELDAAANG